MRRLGCYRCGILCHFALIDSRPLLESLTPPTLEQAAQLPLSIRDLAIRTPQSENMQSPQTKNNANISSA